MTETQTRYAARNGAPADPVGPDAPARPRGQDLVAGTRPGVRADEVDAVHQMRVATRRLRSRCRRWMN